MRALLVACLLAGCLSPADSPEAPQPIDLGPAETLRFTPDFAPIRCAPDARPDRGAPISDLYSSFAVAVRHAAKALAIDLSGVELEERRVITQGATFAWMDQRFYDGAGAPARLYIRLDGSASQLNNATIARLQELTQQPNLVNWNGPAGGWIMPEDLQSDGRIMFQGYPDGSAEVNVFAHHIGPPLESTTLGAAQEYASCAHPGAVVDEGTPGIQYESRVRWHRIKLPDDNHHCGGRAWYAAVEADGDVLSEREHICY